MGDEVIHDRALLALGEGGEGATLPLLQPIDDGLGARRTSRHCPSWARCVRPLPHLPHPRRSRWWGTMYRPPQSRLDGGLVLRRPSLPRKI